MHLNNNFLRIEVNIQKFLKCFLKKNLIYIVAVFCLLEFKANRGIFVTAEGNYDGFSDWKAKTAKKIPRMKKVHFLDRLCTFFFNFIIQPWITLKFSGLTITFLFTFQVCQLTLILRNLLQSTISAHSCPPYLCHLEKQKRFKAKIWKIKSHR